MFFPYLENTVGANSPDLSLISESLGQCGLVCPLSAAKPNLVILE